MCEPVLWLLLAVMLLRRRGLSAALFDRQEPPRLSCGVPLQLMHAVGTAYADLAVGEAQLGVPQLADRLRTLGYSVRVRTALGATGAPIDGGCLRNLRHQFLTLTLPNSGERPGPGAMRLRAPTAVGMHA